MIKVLVLGASGMLGSAMIREISRDSQLQVWGSLRSDTDKAAFTPQIAEHLISGVDVLNEGICDTLKSGVWEPAANKLNSIAR